MTRTSLVSLSPTETQSPQLPGPSIPQGDAAVMTSRVLLLLGAVLTFQGIAGLPQQSSSTTLATVSSNHTEPTSATPVTGESCALDKPTNVTMEEIPKGISSGSIVLVDVRTPQVLLDTGKIPGSHNIQLSEVATAFALSPELFKAQYGFPKPSAEKLVFSCRSGRQATEAWRRTRDLGYCHARVYFGSFLEWSEKKQPIEKVTAGN